MSVKRVDFITPIPEPANRRRVTSSVQAGGDLEVHVSGGMVTLSRAGCDSVMVPMTNVKAIIVEPSAPQTESKKGK